MRGIAPLRAQLEYYTLIYLLADLEALDDIIGYSHAAFPPVTCRRRVHEHFMRRESTEISA